MLRNFVDDEYLRKFYPNLDKMRGTDQSSFSDQIDRAFNQLTNDLRNLGQNPRLLMTPLDLKRLDTAAENDPIRSTAETVTTTGEAFRWRNERRIVVHVTDFTLDAPSTLKLQGSNKTSKPVAGDASWEDVPDSSVAVGQVIDYTLVVKTLYRWVRYVNTITGAGSVTYQVYLLENTFDDIIVQGTFGLIFGEYPDKVAFHSKQYSSMLNAVKFSVDETDEGTISDEEELAGSSQVRFTR